jgi:hypothetical protein
MRIYPIVYGVLVLTVFFGIILGFQSAGIWSVSGKVDASGAAIQPLASDLNTIKGWMTLEQISSTFNVPLAELLTEFNLPADTPSSTAISSLESDLFSVTNLRTWLQSRVQTTGQTQNPSPTPDPTEAISSTPEEMISVIATEHVALEMTVTGKTTFQELLDWGVSVKNIQKVIGSDLPPSSTIIKDYVTGKGLEFTGVRTQLQAEVDLVK